MTKYEIIQIDGDHAITWASLDAHEVRNTLPYFMKMNHPEDFFLVDTEKDKMFPVPFVYNKMKEYWFEV